METRLANPGMVCGPIYDRRHIKVVSHDMTEPQSIDDNVQVDLAGRFPNHFPGADPNDY